MKVSRRSFLKLIGAAVATGVAVPAFAKNRAPYVLVGESVSHIGRCPGGFIGGKVVKEILPWDGCGYPVMLHSGIYGGRARPLERYYDFDLVNFRRELPERFWSLPGSKRYPNVHTYVRTQRFGETIAEAMGNLNFSGVRMPVEAFA